MARHRADTRRRGGWLSNLLIIVGVALLLVAGGMWAAAQWRYHEQDQVNRMLAAYATVRDNELDSETSRPPEVDWAGLKAINADVVGWLQVPGTTINYPVYQGKDNQHYLRHSATGEWTLGGQLFIDYECTRPGMVDNLTLVYGHHLLDGSMFEQIAAMDDQSRFNEIKTVWYVTEQTAYECEPLFLYYVHADDMDARLFRFQTDGEFRAYLKERLGRAVTMRDDAAQIIPGVSHALCLITCNYYEEYEGHGRTILVCVPKAEAAAALAGSFLP